MNRARAAFLFLLVISGFLISNPGVAPKAADEIQIFIGDKRQPVRSRENGGQTYFELRDLVGIFSLSYQEQGNKLTLIGPRGELELVDNRRLVRFRDEYILLDLPLWKRKEREWYVPVDFVDKALPLILSQKLEKQTGLRYRVRPLDENVVQVEVSNFPDHVRIVFTPSRPGAIRVQEGKDALQVKFDEFLVIPRLGKTEADSRVVRDIHFVPTEVFGAFEISKGSDYYNFREYSLERPDRKVIDVYATPVAAREPVTEPVIPGAVAPPTGPAPSPPGAAPEAVPVFRPHQFGNLVTVDPGHGGQDYGVQVGQEDLEKTHTLRIAQRLEQKMRATRYRAVLTRGHDLDLALAQRSAIGNYYQSKCYVSLHLGGAPAQETRGPVVYVHSYAGEAPASPADQRLVAWDEGQRPFLARSRELANLIQAELNGVFGVKNQVVEAPLAQLAPIQAPAVIVEAGFLTNPNDRAQLSSPDFEEKIAGAIAKAMDQFLP